MPRNSRCMNAAGLRAAIVRRISAIDGAQILLDEARPTLRALDVEDAQRLGVRGRDPRPSRAAGWALRATRDGGAICTNDDSLAEKCRLLRVHGSGTKTYYHKFIGINSRDADPAPAARTHGA